MNNEILLGKDTTYPKFYDKKLLSTISRSLGRSKANIELENLPFRGVDFWNCYELSWLEPQGKPIVKILNFYYESSSEVIVESKSLKLYLNSFNCTKFDNENIVEQTIKRDLSELLNIDVKVQLFDLSNKNFQINNFTGILLDDLDIETSIYEVDKNLLKLDENEQYVEETLQSNLLKSNCLVTNQPDWASVMIKYKGNKIDQESMLKYIISFRNHSEFHEQCVEHMFNDIMDQCGPEELTIYAKYTRRGGIDINPFRTNVGFDATKINIDRTVRQ